MKKKHTTFDENENRRLDICQHAPEWAEHARSYEDQGPCDDGRAGVICGNRKGEKPCQIN